MVQIGRSSDRLGLEGKEGTVLRYGIGFRADAEIPRSANRAGTMQVGWFKVGNLARWLLWLAGSDKSRYLRFVTVPITYSIHNYCLESMHIAATAEQLKYGTCGIIGFGSRLE